MPRKPHPPRLYLRYRFGREPIWVIRDGANEVSTGCDEGSRKLAEQKLGAYLTTRHTPAKGEKSLERILVADVFTVYLTDHAPYIIREDFVRYTAESAGAWWGDKYLSQINAKSCSDYVKWRTAQGVSDQTARHDLKTLRAAIHYYHKSEYGPLPAVPVVSLPAAAPAKEDYHLSRLMVAQRLRVARRNKRWRHVCRQILIGFYSGTRPGATLLLHWHENPHGGWADLDNGILYRSARCDSDRKKPQPKARIHDRLLAHMRRWRRLDQKKGINIIVHYNGGPIKKLRRSWKAVAIKAKHLQKGQKEGPHIMRHTAATWLMQDGIPAAEVAGFVGMSQEVLERVYGHHHPDYQGNAATARGRRKKRTAPVSPRISVNESQTEGQNGAVIAFKAPESKG